MRIETSASQSPFCFAITRVFNVEQTEGIADRLGLGNASPRIARIDECERIVSGMPNPPAMHSRCPRVVSARYRHRRDAIAPSVRLSRGILFHAVP